MQESELFLSAKKVVEECRGVRQTLAALPPNVEVEIILDGRMPCTLAYKDESVVFEARESAAADLSYTVFPECIRILSSNSPDTMLALTQEITSQLITGHMRFKLKTNWRALFDKGYHRSFEKMGPELQAHFSKYAFLLMSQASTTLDKIKNILRS